MIWACVFGHKFTIYMELTSRDCYPFIVHKKVIDPKYQALYPILICWAYFGGIIGVAARRASKNLEPQNPTKRFANLVDLFGQLLSRQLVYKLNSPAPPPHLNGRIIFDILWS